MEWSIILALVIAIPVILFGAAFTWYMTASGLFQVIRVSQRRKAMRKALIPVPAKIR